MYTGDIDIGGTFTDGFFTNGAEAQVAKVLTTPYDITECFLNCLKEGAEQFAVDLKQFLQGMKVLRLSTTLGTNLLVQRSGPKVGLLVSAGQEQLLYGNNTSEVVGQLISREMVLGIEETVDDHGHLVRATEKEETLQAVRQLINSGARMIAVSFCNGILNPANERRVREFVRERYPVHYLRSIPLQLGTDVSQAASDRLRTHSVLVNAYLHQEMARVLYRAEDRVRESGYTLPLLIVHAHGGSARVAKTVALQTLSSGPAVATRGAAMLARLLQLPYVLTADMGGTSLDVALIIDGRYDVDLEPEVEGISLFNPMIRVGSLGAGGGSIAQVVSGELKVGPESAGAVPGPVAYNKGGIQPTVTDANIILGFINPDYFLGGRMRLDADKARRAIEQRVSKPLGLKVETGALAVRSRINQTMANGMSERIRHQGLNPSQFTLFGFGGAGPLHACDVAALIGIERVVAFPYGAVFSAFGSSSTDVLHSYLLSLNGRVDIEDLSPKLAELRKQASRDMRGEGFPDDEVRFSLDLVVDQGGNKFQKHFAGPTLGSRFGDDTMRNWANEITRAGQQESATHLILLAESDVFHWTPPFIAEEERSTDSAYKGERWVYWDEKGPKNSVIFDRDRLRPGDRIEGPAIIEAPDTSYSVPPAWCSRMDNYGNLVFEHRR